jgi:hypothetical protein
MGAADEVKVVLCVELANDVLSEAIAYAAVAIAVFFYATFGIRPEQVAEEACVRHICWAHDVLDLLQLLEFRAQAAMHTEDFLINQRSHRQAIKHIRKDFPKFD